MPTVPRYDGAKAAARSANIALMDAPNVPALRAGFPSIQVATPPAMRAPGFVTPRLEGRLDPAMNASQMTVAARQLEETGGSLAGLGGELGRIALAVQSQTNQLVVDNAVNQAKEVQMRLAYDKDVGFTNLRGFDALNRPDGKPLAEEYVGKFQETLKSISGGLKNDAQRLAFSQEAARLRQSLESQAIQHESSQFREYNLSTQEGTIKTSIQEIGVNYNNPEIVDAARERMKRAVYNQGVALGKSATWIEAQQRDMLSQAHKVAIGSALENDNIVYADGYLKKYAGEMNADDLLQVRGIVNKEIDQQVAFIAADEAMSGVAPAMGPVNDFDRMVRITAQSESGNRERDAKGNLITSPKGAQGKMQVMPGTNTAPGFGVTPARDGSDAERTRVGRDYLKAMLQRYEGDAAKAWAAYNAGPGRLDAAVKAARKDGGHWFDRMPKETRDYVEKNLRAMGSGAGAPERPTLGDALAAVRADPRVAGSPARLQVAEARVTQRFRETEADFKMKGDDLYTRAMTAVAQGSSYEDLPVALRAGLEVYAPEKVSQVRGFAKNQAEGYNTTDLATYQLLSDDRMLASLTDAQFLATRDKLSREDWQKFADERGRLRSPSASSDQSPGALNSPVINVVLKDRLAGLGLDPTPDPKKDPEGTARVGAVTRYVRESLGVAQRQAGKKFTDVETEQFIDGLFMKNREFRNEALLGFNRKYSMPLLSMTIKDIPAESLKELRDAFRARGNSDPSAGDLLAAYFRWKG